MEVSVLATGGTLLSIEDVNYDKILSFAMDTRQIRDLREWGDRRDYSRRCIVNACTTISKFSLVCRRWAHLICKTESWEDLALVIPCRTVPDPRGHYCRLHLICGGYNKWCKAWSLAKFICISHFCDKMRLCSHYKKNADAFQTPPIGSEWQSSFDEFCGSSSESSNSEAYSVVLTASSYSCWPDDPGPWSSLSSHSSDPFGSDSEPSDDYFQLYTSPNGHI